MQRRSWAIATLLIFALAWAAIAVHEGLADDYPPGGNPGPGGSRRPTMDRRFPAGTAITCPARRARRTTQADRRRGRAGRRVRTRRRRPTQTGNRRKPPPWRSTAAPFPTPPPIIVTSSLILGRVGSEYVLCADILAGLDQYFDRDPKRVPPAQYEQERRANVEQIMEAINDFAAHVNERDPVAAMLPSHRMVIKTFMNRQIETKLTYNDARRNIPAEKMPMVEDQLSKEFDKSELDTLLKRLNAQSRQELDEKLRSMGSSLEHEKRAFMQQVLGQQWVKEQVKFDEEITHEQMLQWYQTHLSDFETPCQARWEELMVRIAKYPSKADAWAAIARMGDQVAAGAPLRDVARAQSDGWTALSGGLCDWVGKGSLKAEKVDEALFGLPIGQLSPILESETDFYIVRVLEPPGDDAEAVRRRAEGDREEESARRKSPRGTRSIWRSSAARRRFRPSSTSPTPRPNACRNTPRRRGTDEFISKLTAENAEDRRGRESTVSFSAFLRALCGERRFQII